MACLTPDGSHPYQLFIASSSFGVVTWELLTGEKPYAGLNMWAIIFGVGQGTLSLPIPEGCPVFLRELMNGGYVGMCMLVCVCVCACVYVCVFECGCVCELCV